MERSLIFLRWEKKKNGGEWAEKKRLTVLSAALALRVKVFLLSNLLRSLLGLKKSPKDVGIFVCVVREFKVWILWFWRRDFQIFCFFQSNSSNSAQIQ